MERETVEIIQKLFTTGAQEVTLRQAIDAFLTAELGGLAPLTREWYRKRLYPMSDELGVDRPLISVMEADLVRWYADLAARTSRYVTGTNRPMCEGGLSKDTLHGYVRACRRFFAWLYKRDIMPANISENLHLPRLPRRGKKGVADMFAKEILEAAKDNPRDYALIRFLEMTGCRRGGAANLKLSDLSLDSPDEKHRRRVTVREKGDKERVVVLTPAALEALKGWLSVRPSIPDEHVFLGQRPGHPWKPLTEVGISEVLRRYKIRLAIPGTVSPHQWRHRWCRKRLQEGMGLKQVSQLAGHEGIGVTAQFYGAFLIDDLQQDYDRLAKDIQLD